MMRPVYVAVLAACLLTAAAVAGSAAAAPSAPQLAAVPFYVSADQPISWSKSFLDPDGLAGLTSYEFQLADLTSGGSTNTYRPWVLPTTANLDALFPNVVAPHEYVLCVFAVEVTTGYSVRFSARTCIHFEVTYTASLGDLRRLLDKYVAINPNPECIVCGPDLGRYEGDPAIRERIDAGLTRQPAPITGVSIDARGGFAVVTG
jgi:hypothetical protein